MPPRAIQISSLLDEADQDRAFAALYARSEPRPPRPPRDPRRLFCGHRNPEDIVVVRDGWERDRTGALVRDAEGHARPREVEVCAVCSGVAI